MLCFVYASFTGSFTKPLLEVTDLMSCATGLYIRLHFEGKQSKQRIALLTYF